MIICICNNVSDTEVVETAKFVGAKTVEDLQACIFTSSVSCLKHFGIT